MKRIEAEQFRARIAASTALGTLGRVTYARVVTRSDDGVSFELSPASQRFVGRSRRGRSELLRRTSGLTSRSRCGRLGRLVGRYGIPPDARRTHGIVKDARLEFARRRHPTPLSFARTVSIRDLDAQRLVCRVRRRLGHAGGEADRPDAQAGGGAQGRACGARGAGARRAGRAPAPSTATAPAPRRRARPRSRPRPRRSRRRRPPRRGRSSSSPSSPAIQGRSQEPPGKSSALGAITARAGRVGGAQRRHRRRQLAQRVELAQLGLDRLLGRRVFALAEVEPGQRAAQAPEEEAGPALAAVGVPERPLGVDRDRELDPEPPRARRRPPSGSAPNGKRGAWTPIVRRPASR